MSKRLTKAEMRAKRIGNTSYNTFAALVFVGLVFFTGDPQYDIWRATACGGLWFFAVSWYDLLVSEQ